jgi:hypothetical protein
MRRRRKKKRSIFEKTQHQSLLEEEEEKKEEDLFTRFSICRCYEKRTTRHHAAPARKSPAVRLPCTADSNFGVLLRRGAGFFMGRRRRSSTKIALRSRLH